MKIVSWIAATAVLTLPCSVASIAPEPVKPPSVVEQATPALVRQPKLLVSHMSVLERKTSARDRLQKSMPLPDQRTRDESVEYRIQKEIYSKNLVAISDVDARARASARPRLDSDRIGDEDRTLWRAAETEKKAKRKRRRPRTRAPSSRAPLIRYEGAANWSVRTGFDKIDRFYRERFGRPLPISAMGQSPTHDRLGLDHSDAVDVAVRPDSASGRGLMAFLRRSDIPFIAFRRRMSRMSTGPHIHIGRPSPRLLEVKQRAAASEETAENG